MKTKPTEELNREIEEIWGDMKDVADDGDALSRLADTMNGKTAESPVLGVLSSMGVPFVETVEAVTASGLLDAKDVIRAILPDLVRMSIAIGMVIGREHQRRGYDL